jgi:hypothetical protein
MKIYIGKKTPEHKGDTSRELMDIWKENNFCEIIEEQVEDCFIWANEPRKILLYEYDRWDVFPWLPKKWEKGVFAGMQHPNGLPWIYWGRRPKILHSKIEQGLKSFEDRQTESIFLGKIENAVQLQNRTKFDWSKYIEFFSMPIQMGDSFKWKYTQEEYLEHIGNSKFGLCLPGYGPKCNREIEYFGLGVIPLITKDVCIKYPEPLLENIHFLRINSPEDIKKCLKNFSKDRWEFMSYSGRRWYERNCSPRGSFEITEKIVSSIK